MSVRLHGWTDQDVADHVTGSGAGQYSWYHAIEEVDGGFLVTIDDPCGSGVLERAFTASQFHATAVAIAFLDAFEVGDRICGYIRDDDLDADAVDCVIQALCLGEIVYN